MLAQKISMWKFFTRKVTSVLYHWRATPEVTLGTNSRAGLMCTETVQSAVADIPVDYNYFGFDNVPMMFTVKLGFMPEIMLHQKTCTKI